MGYYETTGYDGGREVDIDAIQRTFSQYGATYYGDGSEFIYSAGGYDAVNDIAVRNAAERAAQEARQSETAERMLIQMLAAKQREAMSNKYYRMDRTQTWFLHEGAVSHVLLLHDAHANCPYCVNASGELGPFFRMGEAMKAIDQYYNEETPTFPCPVCTENPNGPGHPLYELVSGMMAACKQALESGRVHKEDYFKPKAPAAPPKPMKEYREPAVLSKVSFMYETSTSMPFLRSAKIDSYSVVREIATDGRHNVYQLNIVFDVPSLVGKLPSVLEDVMILLRRFKDTRPISDEEKWKNIGSTPVSSYGEKIELMKIVPLTLIPSMLKYFSDGTALALYRVNLIIDENESPFTDGVYLFYLEVGGTAIEKMSIYHPRKIPDQPDKPYLSGKSYGGHTAPARTESSTRTPKNSNTVPQNSKTAPKNSNTIPKDSGRQSDRTIEKKKTQPEQPKAPAQPIDNPPLDCRAYVQPVNDVEDIIYNGSDPAIRGMRMEGFEVKVSSTSIVYTVTINTTEPLKMGSTMNLLTNCDVKYSVFLGFKDLLAEDMTVRMRKAKVTEALQSPYKGQYCYSLKIGLGPLEWKKKEMKGRKTCGFIFDILGVPYLKDSNYLTGEYNFR